MDSKYSNEKKKNINSIYFKFKIIIVLGLHYVSVHNSAASH